MPARYGQCPYHPRPTHIQLHKFCVHVRRDAHPITAYTSGQRATHQNIQQHTYTAVPHAFHSSMPYQASLSPAQAVHLQLQPQHTSNEHLLLMLYLPIASTASLSKPTVFARLPAESVHTRSDRSRLGMRLHPSSPQLLTAASHRACNT